MRLFVVQHGDAVPKEVDSDRPLSNTGRHDVEHVAAFLAGADIRVTAIFHSGKKRAQQTADVLAKHIAGATHPGRISGIDPLDPVEIFVPQIIEWTSDTMVVGHMPFLGKLVSLLTVENTESSVAAFRPGTVVCLEREENGAWSIAWMIRPELLRGE